jgi:hypothetical protein
MRIKLLDVHIRATYFVYQSQRWTPQIFFVRRWQFPQSLGLIAQSQIRNFLDEQHFFESANLRIAICGTCLRAAQQKSKSPQTLVLVSTEIKGLNKKFITILAFHTFFNVDSEKM